MVGCGCLDPGLDNCWFKEGRGGDVRKLGRKWICFILARREKGEKCFHIRLGIVYKPMDGNSKGVAGSQPVTQGRGRGGVSVS